MSNAIAEPWIVPYLIETGETWGDKLSSVPPYAKTRKVRLTNVLSYPESENTAAVWVKISDHVQEMPARFSKESVSGMGQNNILRNVNAIFTIQNFRPICSRVPVGHNVKKMTQETHLVLDVLGNVKVVGGGRGDSRSAKDIEENAEIMEWTCGLREDGDGGNILKRRKQTRDGESSNIPPARVTSTSVAQTVRPATRRQVETEFKIPIQPRDTSTLSRVRTGEYNDFSRCRKSWGDKWKNPSEWQKPLERKKTAPQSTIHASTPSTTNTIELASSHNAIYIKPSSLPLQSPRRASMRSPKPTTPSHWSPSIRGSQSDSDVEDAGLSTLSQHIPLEPSVVLNSGNEPDVFANPTSVSLVSGWHVDDPAVSSSKPNPPSPRPDRDADSKGLTSVGSSPLHPPPSTAPNSHPNEPDPSDVEPSPSLSQPPPHETELKRRVPYPVFCSSQADSNESRVLVPDSDSSAIGSQPRMLDDSITHALGSSQSCSLGKGDRPILVSDEGPSDKDLAVNEIDTRGHNRGLHNLSSNAFPDTNVSVSTTSHDQGSAGENRNVTKHPPQQAACQDGPPFHVPIVKHGKINNDSIEAGAAINSRNASTFVSKAPTASSSRTSHNQNAPSAHETSPSQHNNHPSIPEQLGMFDIASTWPALANCPVGASLDHDPEAWRKPTFMKIHDKKAKPSLMSAPHSNNQLSLVSANEASGSQALNQSSAMGNKSVTHNSKNNLSSRVPNGAGPSPPVTPPPISPSSVPKVSMAPPATTSKRPQAKVNAQKHPQELNSIGSSANAPTHKRARSADRLPKTERTSNGGAMRLQNAKVKEEPTEVKLELLRLTKLNGYCPDFENMVALPDIGRPKVMTLGDIDDCLLSIGRQRYN